jgi:hypothetical protein
MPPRTLEWLTIVLMNPSREIPKVLWCPKHPNEKVGEGEVSNENRRVSP